MTIKSATRLVLLATFGLLLARPASSADVAVVACDMDWNTRLYLFSLDGTFLASSQGPAPNYYTSITAQGGSLYVSDYEGMIEQFNASGHYIGQFADVGADLLGSLTGNLDCDSRGNLYVHNMGSHSEPRNAGRYDLASGDLTQTYSHPDLVFPCGIDADAAGNVYVVNSAAVGVENRVYKFSPDGALLGAFAPDFIDSPADLAVDEENEVLFVSDEFGGANAVHAYSLADSSFGVHIKTISVPAVDWAVGLHYEPLLGHLFITSSSPSPGSSAAYEIDTDGNVIHTYQLPELTLVLDVVYVPEPATLSLLALSGLVAIRRMRKRAPATR